MVFLLPPNIIIPKHTGEVLVTFQTNLNKQKNVPIFNLSVIYGDKIMIAQHRTSLITLTDKKKKENSIARQLAYMSVWSSVPLWTTDLMKNIVHRLSTHV